MNSKVYHLVKISFKKIEIDNKIYKKKEINTYSAITWRGIFSKISNIWEKYKNEIYQGQHNFILLAYMESSDGIYAYDPKSHKHLWISNNYRPYRGRKLFKITRDELILCGNKWTIPRIE
jgi:hypothetical protein